MQFLKRFTLVSQAHSSVSQICQFILLLAAFGCSATPVLAEGSRTMYPSGATGNRANLDQRSTTTLANQTLKARSIFKVYANAGEYILLGSSAVGVGSGDINVFNPGLVTGTIGQETLPATPSFRCSTLRTSTGNTNLGKITSRTQELAGPDTITNTVTGARGNAISTGFVPCYYQAPQTGIYDIYFVPPTPSDTSSTNTTGDIALTSVNNFNTSQDNNVAAWDVTVRSSLTSTTDINGRMFAYYAYLRHGSNARYAYFSLYPVTLDGFRYQINLNGLDPNSFAVYGNRSGFFDPDGVTPLYKDVLGSDDFLGTITGGVVFQTPQFPTFLNPPDTTVISALGIPLVPTAPVVSNFSFSGSLTSNNSLVGAGGTFTFTANVGHTYEIIISRDGVDFDPSNPNNRVLRGIRNPGVNTVTWNGQDNSGNNFPIGNNYPARITIVNGEYHFPIIDAENSLGGPRFTMLNPPGACMFGNCNTAFYDDRGYRLSTGTIVGTVGTVLPGSGPPSTAFSGSSGFDSSTNQRAFGNATTTGWGDKKGLDIWTYYASNAINTPVNILPLAPDLTITKTHSGNFTQGQTGATYTITVTNAGTSSTSGLVTVVDTLPTGLTATAAAGTGWTCSLNTPLPGQVQCTRTDALASGSSYPPITLTVDVAANASVSLINSVVTSGGGETNTSNNTATDPTTITPLLSISGTVFDDADGSKLINGTETGTNGGGLNVVLIDSTNKVVATTTVATNGTYTFNSVPTNSTYTVQVTTATATVGSAPPPVTLPSNWVSTGENLNGTIDGTVDSKLSFSVTTSNITGANFGIEQLPTAVGGTAASQTNPGGTTNVSVPSTVFTGSTDPDGTVESYKITTFPTNATSLTIDGVTYTSGTFPAGGVTVPVAKLNTIQVDPIDGAVSVGISFKAIDNAGQESNNIATATVPFTVPGASNPNLLLVKRITAINGTSINFFDDDTTSAKKDDDNHPYWPTPLNANGSLGSTSISSFLSGKIDAGMVKSGDDLEYTIYFLSAGNVPLKNVNFCDLVPTNTTFQPNSFGPGQGIQLSLGGSFLNLTNVPDSDRAQFLNPGAKLPTYCPSASNPTGAVLVNIVNSSFAAPDNELPNATAPGTPGYSYGFVRFKAKVN